jgi:hypothetical protein
MKDLTSPRSGGRSVGIVRLRSKTTEVFFCFVYLTNEKDLIISLRTDGCYAMRAQRCNTTVQM